MAKARVGDDEEDNKYREQDEDGACGVDITGDPFGSPSTKSSAPPEESEVHHLLRKT